MAWENEVYISSQRLVQGNNRVVEDFCPIPPDLMRLSDLFMILFMFVENNY